MRRSHFVVTSLFLAIVGLGSLALAQSTSWTIPAAGLEEKSPLAPTAEVLKKGKALFGSNCRRCHGPEGKGDGPDGNSETPPADLTLSSRAAANPEGVVFYKVWNGRTKPAMPAFKSQLTKNDVWTIVEYVKTLRN
jgi:mono/diheme cytochrome c family protein